MNPRKFYSLGELKNSGFPTEDSSENSLEKGKKYPVVSSNTPDEEEGGYDEYKAQQLDKINTGASKVIDKLLLGAKKKKIEAVKEKDILEITYNGQIASYTIVSMVDDKITYTRGSDTTVREMTRDALTLIVSDQGVSFTVIGKKEKIALTEFDALIKNLKEKEGVLNNNATDNEKIEFMRDMAQESNIPMAFIEPLYSDKEKKERSRASSAREDREEVIAEIGEMLKKGVDKIVIHGQTTEKGDQVRLEPKFDASLDTDTKGALFLLNLAKGVNYNEGSYTELALKGSKGQEKEREALYHTTKRKEDMTILYIDTSGEKLSFKLGKNGKEIFIDHHQKYFSKYMTSATELMYETLVKNEMIETEPWMEDLVDFVTNIDNLLYVNDEGYNEKSLEHEWPKSMFAIYKNVPFEKIVSWFKEGKNPFKPEFTHDELKEVLTRTTWEENDEGKSIAKEEKVTLQDIIEEKKLEIGSDISNAKFAIKVMEKRGIKSENEKLGKVIYNKQDRQTEIKEMEKGRNPVNKIYNGFLVTKALGYDTYATYNEKYNRFMVNTNNYNLDPIYAEFEKIVPETVLVRGVMLMQPSGLTKRKAMTEDIFLKILKLKE